MLEQYPNEVRLVFKNYPLQEHKFALQAAVAALAAHKQGMFWDLHDHLFFYQDQLNEKEIHELALEVGLDMEEFKRDLKDPNIMAIISRDISEGDRAGVTGVPTIFVNGKLLKDRSLAGLHTLIQREIKTARELNDRQ